MRKVHSIVAAALMLGATCIPAVALANTTTQHGTGTTTISPDTYKIRVGG